MQERITLTFAMDISLLAAILSILQVPVPEQQHKVMIEAVENHMPEVIVIDEIGSEAEAIAAATIAQRGVQLVATAHGDRIENILNNPTLQGLLGGVERSASDLASNTINALHCQLYFRGIQHLLKPDFQCVQLHLCAARSGLKPIKLTAVVDYMPNSAQVPAASTLQCLH